MRKLFFAAILVAFALFLSASNVSAANSTNVTVNQVITAAGTVQSYIETNHALPGTVNISGNQVSMPQFLKLLTTAVLNINSGSNATIALGNYSSAPSPSENITSRNISKSEYLDIANRVKSYMDSNGRAPNYATQTSTGNAIRFESLIYMYSKILNSYHTKNALPDSITVNPWTSITGKTNGTKVIGSTGYGYVEKEIYGNQNSNQTIVIIVGVHPQENGMHTAIANALASKSAQLSKRYVIYKVHVTQDASDYTKGRMNGQLLAQQFVVPDVSKENPMLAVDIHENHGADSGYDYYRFLYPVSNTAITTTYANEIISAMPFLVIYSPPNPTSTQYVTVPIANKGIPTIIYETYLSDSTAKKASDANAFIDALNSKIGNTKPTASANPKGGLYNINKVITLSMNKAGTIYYTTNGATPTTASTKYTGPITISSTTTLKFISVDAAGNKSPVYTETYTIDKTAPKVTSTSPSNGATGISRTATISIKFSENIKTSTNWSKIYMKNLNTGKTVTITTSTSGNTLYIKMKLSRISNNQYQIYIPSAAVKDSAGNNLAAAYTFKFKSG